MFLKVVGEGRGFWQEHTTGGECQKGGGAR